MIRDILIYPNPKLKETSEAVLGIHLGEDLEQLAYDLIATMNANRGIGIAAIQVGVPKRIIVVKTEGGGELVMVNPVIMSRNAETKPRTEGCLSFPGIFEVVERHIDVGVHYLNIHGNPRSGFFAGRDAHVIQHETEHLDGMLLSDRMSRSRRGLVMGELKKLRRKR